jgi:hypothetical protein
MPLVAGLVVLHNSFPTLFAESEIGCLPAGNPPHGQPAQVSRGIRRRKGLF